MIYLPRMFLSLFLLWVVCSPRTGLAQPGKPKNVLINNEEGAAPFDIKPADVILWSADPIKLYQDGSMSLVLRLETRQEFSIYKDKLVFLPPPGLSLIKFNAPPHAMIKDPITGKNVEVYDGGTFELELASFGKLNTTEIEFGITSLGCTTRICLFPYTARLKIGVVGGGASSPLQLSSQSNPENGRTDGALSEGKTTDATTAEPDIAASAAQPHNALRVPDTPGKDVLQAIAQDTNGGESKSWEARIADQLKGDISFWLLVSLIFVGGLLTNLTPCVYPMIPITLRVLAHQGASAKTASALYGLGILVTYTTLGLLAAWSGSVFGSFMASPTFNVLLAIIMIILGFTMLGYGNLSWLQNLGSRFGASSHKKSNAFAMGIGAGLVASPCTGPILASLLAVTSSRQNPAEAAMLLGVYSFGFALPYVFLGAFSAKIPKKRFSPRVQVAVKTLFAGAIFSVAFIYLKIPFGPAWAAIEPHVIQMGRIFGLLSLLMFALILVSKQLFEKKSLHILPALLSGIAMFSLFESRFTAASSEKIPWITTEDVAFALAEKENRPILVDTWAEWCVACKKMEIETFMDPKIRREFDEQNWVLLKLDLTEENEFTEAIQEKYDIKSLPTVTIIPRGGMSQFGSKRTLIGYQDVPSLFQEIIKERQSP